MNNIKHIYTQADINIIIKRLYSHHRVDARNKERYTIEFKDWELAKNNNLSKLYYLHIRKYKNRNKQIDKSLWDHVVIYQIWKIHDRYHDILHIWTKQAHRNLVKLLTYHNSKAIPRNYNSSIWKIKAWHCIIKVNDFKRRGIESINRESTTWSKEKRRILCKLNSRYNDYPSNISVAQSFNTLWDVAIWANIYKLDRREYRDGWEWKRVLQNRKLERWHKGKR